jgi:hypothetical protein
MLSYDDGNKSILSLLRDDVECAASIHDKSTNVVLLLVVVSPLANACSFVSP